MLLRAELKKLANPKIAKNSQRFFKTGKGDYGYGDIFIGVKMPEIRMLAKKHIELGFTDIKELIKSKIHEMA